MNALEKYATKRLLIEKLAIAAPILLGGGAGYLKGKKVGKSDEGAIRGAGGATGGSLLGALLGARLADPVMKRSAAFDVRRYKSKKRKAIEKFKGDLKRHKGKSFKEQLRAGYPKRGKVPMLNPYTMLTKAQNRAVMAALLATGAGGGLGYSALTAGLDDKKGKKK